MNKQQQLKEGGGGEEEEKGNTLSPSSFVQMTLIDDELFKLIPLDEFMRPKQAVASRYGIMAAQFNTWARW